MAVKLIVHNIPHNVSQEEFRSKFLELRGFQDSKLMMGNNNELYGIVEFSSYELAEYARKMMSSHVFQGSNQPLNIEIMRNQDGYDYNFQNNQNMGQNLYNNRQNQSVDNMNFQNNPNYHFQNQQMNQQINQQ